MNGWSWLKLHNFLNPFKQATAGLSELPAPYFLLSGPRHSTSSSLDSQLGLAWESLSLAQVAAISHCSIVQAGWSWTKHRWGLTLAYTIWEIPGPVHPLGGYRPHQSTTFLPLHS